MNDERAFPALTFVAVLAMMAFAESARALDGEAASVDAAESEDTPGEKGIDMGPAVEIDEESGSLDDALGSIDAGRQTFGQNFAGDLRFGYSRTDKDNRDTSTLSTSEWRGRFRAGGSYSIAENLVFGGRLASSCSSDKCDPSLVLDSTLPTQTSIEDGEITFDQLYIHAMRRKRFNVAFGRLQTKFVSRAGVFTKSLDRADSTGTNVNWTDGVHGVMHFNKASSGHIILQKNQADGTGNIRRGPIDFSDEDARISYFLAWENTRRIGPINQQGIDLTYMPKSLLKDGDNNGRTKDYVAVVARVAASWPEGSVGRRLNIAGEVGYAPETPTRAAVGLPGEGDTDGVAWLVSASVVDFRKDHSIGVNYGRVDAGWLISPQYRENEEAFEIRYMWRRSANLAIDIRARWRDELEQEEDAAEKRQDLNVFARFTLGFGY